MDVQIVHHRDEFLAGKDVIHQLPDRKRPVAPRLSVRHLHPSPSGQRRKDYEPVGRAIVRIPVVHVGGLSGTDQAGHARLIRLLH